MEISEIMVELQELGNGTVKMNRYDYIDGLSAIRIIVI